MNKKILVLITDEQLCNLVSRQLAVFADETVIVSSHYDALQALQENSELALFICAFGGYAADKCQEFFQLFVDRKLTIVAYGDLPQDCADHKFFDQQVLHYLGNPSTQELVDFVKCHF
ncbi:MAG: hypothetical protein Q8Q23_01300 [bacterium]|nr:hypothetical protein [bacterium]